MVWGWQRGWPWQNSHRALPLSTGGERCCNAQQSVGGIVRFQHLHSSHGTCRGLPFPLDQQKPPEESRVPREATQHLGYLTSPMRFFSSGAGGGRGRFGSGRHRCSPEVSGRAAAVLCSWKPSARPRGVSVGGPQAAGAASCQPRTSGPGIS